jgi:hypothetical protein
MQIRTDAKRFANVAFKSGLSSLEAYCDQIEGSLFRAHHHRERRFLPLGELGARYQRIRWASWGRASLSDALRVSAKRDGHLRRLAVAGAASTLRRRVRSPRHHTKTT